MCDDAELAECEECGATGSLLELFDESGLEECCGGTGYVNCYCDGDRCKCHHHGEIECAGCEDCLDIG